MKNKDLMKMLHNDMNNIAVPDVLEGARSAVDINTAPARSEEPRRRSLKRFLPVTVMAVLLIAVLIPLQLFVFSFDTTSAATLTVDINPSVRLEINEDGKVVQAEGLNEDGISILSNVRIKRRTIEDAVEIILEASSAAGYDDSNVSYAITSDNEELGNSLRNRVEQRTRAYYANKHKQGNIEWREGSTINGNGNGNGGQGNGGGRN